MNETFHEQTNDELTEKELKQVKADDHAIQTILIGLSKDIYAVVDSCETTQEIWFTSTDGESIECYYHHFSKLMNDFKRNKHFPENIASNLKFLNNLQPKWSRHVTIVHQTKDLHIADYTQLYDLLKYNQKEIDDLRAERIAKTHDLLALMANSNNPFNYLVFHQDQPSPSIQTKLLTPTNNNQRISSNPRNRQIAQPGMNIGQDRQMQKVRGNGGNQFRQYVGQNVGNQNGYNAAPNVKNQVVQNAVQNLGVQNVGNQNGLIVVPGIANQNPNGNGNVVAARAKGNTIGNNGNQIKCYNCRGLGHLVRNCTVRQKRRDAAYLQTQLLIAQKEEAEIQLQAKEFDLMAAAADLDEIEEVNVNCIFDGYILQQARHRFLRLTTLSSIDGLWCGTRGGTVEQHLVTVEEKRAYFESLYNNLTIEVEKVNTVNHKLRETNADLTTELDRNKNQEKSFENSQEKYDKLERCYQKSVYQEQCLTKKINALHLSSGKQIMALNEEISNLNSQLSKEKSTISSLQEEKKRFKSDFNIREDELLDKQIQLENKIKELDNILLSKKQQSLYNGKVLLEKHDPPAVYDLEETLQLAQESREKMKQLNKEIKPANYTKINHLSGVFVSQTAKSREESYFTNTSKTDNVSKSISIPNEEFSDDTTPSVARKFLNEVKSTIVTLQRIVKQKMTLDIHDWSSSVHQEIHKVLKDEIFPIINQVDARVQNFEIQFLKEAAKFVRDLKSLTKEADESLAKHKALELEIERLLRAVVSKDIMSIENEYAKLWNDWYKKCKECKYDKISYDKAYNDTQQKIERLQAQLGDTKGKSKDNPCVSDTLDHLPHKLENENVELEFHVRNYEKENAHLKTAYKNLFLNKRTPTSMNTKFVNQSTESNPSLQSLRNTSVVRKPNAFQSERLNFSKTRVPQKVDKTNDLSNPVTSNSVSTTKESKVVENDKVIAPGMFRINPFKNSREVKSVPNKPIKVSVRTNLITIPQPHVITKKVVNSNSNGFSSTGVDITTKTRRPQPRSNTKNDRVLSASKSSCIKNKEVEVKEHPRNLLLSKNKKHMSSECNNVKLAIRNDKSKICSRTVRFGNDHVAAILGFGDLQWGNILITRVYFVEGLGHNLFLVGQFCDSNPEDTFRRNTCFVKNLEGFDLLKGKRTTNLDTINIHDMASASLIYLMARATSTKYVILQQL
ncbi:retrovirus-related pol polyprotein from transposon TNT 1-94 [Tanacetum coccineum]